MGIAYPSDIDTFDLGARQNLCKDMVFSDDMQGGQDVTRYLIGLGTDISGLLAIRVCRGSRGVLRATSGPSAMRA
jgi:DNA-binding LacI/PurR family transcriptional regulator